MAEMETGYVGSDSGSQGAESSGFSDQAHEKASQVGGFAKKQIVGKLDSQKSVLVSNLDRFAESLDGLQLEGPPAQVVTRVSGAVRKAQGMLNEKSTDELVDLAITEVKNRPAAMIAGAFALGFLGARLLKS